MIVIISLCLVFAIGVGFPSKNQGLVALAETSASVGEVSYDTFKEALDAVNANGGTLKLLDDVTTDNYFAENEAIVFTNINQSITLDLNGYKIDRGLEVATDNGYVIKVNVDVDLTIEDSDSDSTGTITGGYNTGNGGGIHNSGTLTVSNITISGNTSTSDGGGIYNYGDLSIEDCIISNNTADYGGGIENFANASIIRSTIKFNSANYGGGICNDGMILTVESSTISENSATDGGGIFNAYDITIQDCVIEENTATNNGGGLYVYAYGPCETIITGSTTINNNTVNLQANNVYLDYDFYEDIYTYFILTFDDNNIFTGEIGVTLADIEVYDVITETWSDLHTGTVTSDNTSKAVLVGTTTSAGDTLSLSTALATVTIDGAVTSFVSLSEAVDFANGYKTTITDGKGIVITMLNDANITSGLEFSNTSSEITLEMAGLKIDRGLTSATTDGYVIGVNSGVTLIITSTDSIMGVITGGNTTDNGGGIYNDGTLTISNINITENKATSSGDTTGKGGALYSTGTLTVIDSTISGNTAHRGGGMYILDGTVSITDSTISSNTANFRGGGMYILGGEVSIIDSTISSNIASYGNNGGGIYVGADNIVTLTFGGSTTVASNTTGSSTSNIYLESSRTITFDVNNPFTGSIGVAMQTAGEFSSTWDNASTDAIVTSDNNSYVVLISSSDNSTYDTLTIGTAQATVTIDGAVTSFVSLSDAVGFANEYKTTITDGKGIVITMLNDANITSGLAFTNTSKAITLDLNGYKIDRGLEAATANGYVIKVYTGVTLTITSGTNDGDGGYSAEMGIISGGYNSGSSTTVAGGGINNSGTLYLYNIKVTNNSSYIGGGIFNNSLLTIYDSTISGNTAYGSSGGGITNWGT